ncbi:MAG TPA: SseB family protein [Streptosporangiaceae bacterium]
MPPPPAGQPSKDDDGSAWPEVASALAAYADGSGSEHAALTALAGSRLLVPLLAEPAPDGSEVSQVAVPSLVGADGRPAIPGFTSLDALHRWRPGARLVPRPAVLVWQAAMAESAAVVIDVAGPVPVAVDGARLAALASGEPVPEPHEDPDVLATVAEAVARPGAVALAGLSLAGLARGDDGSLMVNLQLAPDGDRARVGQAVAALGADITARLGGRLRQGIAFAISAAS